MCVRVIRACVCVGCAGTFDVCDFLFFFIFRSFLSEMAVGDLRDLMSS